MKKRTAEPWMAADAYGRSLPPFTVNLIVTDIERSVAFYREVLEAAVAHFDADFAALRLNGVDFMLHADHTYEDHPWRGRLAAGEARGLGAEIRVFGLDPTRSRPGGGPTGPRSCSLHRTSPTVGARPCCPTPTGTCGRSGGRSADEDLPRRGVRVAPLPGQPGGRLPSGPRAP